MSAPPPPAPVTELAGGWTQGFRALRHGAFRTWMVAHGLSFAGNWMSRVAMGWLVFRLTGSTLLLGTVVFASQIPVLLLSPMAGVVADRFPLARTVAATEGLLAVHAFTLGVLISNDAIGVPGILVFAALQGVLAAFDMPARHAYVLELAGHADLGSAIALNTAVASVARVAGPAAAGFLVAWVGEGPCFIINGFTFLAPTAVALFVRPGHPRPPPERQRPLAALLEGLAYARRSDHTRLVLPVVAVMSAVALPLMPLLPAFVGDVFQGGPQLLGWLNVALGVGSTVGAVVVATEVRRSRLPARFATGVSCLGLGALGLGLSTSIPLSLLALVVAGFGFAAAHSAGNTFIQIATPDRIRGRVIALYTMMFLGIFPLGSLFMGSVADHVGVGTTVAVGGAVVVLVSLAFLRHLPALREVDVPSG